MAPDGYKSELWGTPQHEAALDGWRRCSLERDEWRTQAENAQAELATLRAETERLTQRLAEAEKWVGRASQYVSDEQTYGGTHKELSEKADALAQRLVEVEREGQEAAKVAAWWARWQIEVAEAAGLAPAGLFGPGDTLNAVKALEARAEALQKHLTQAALDLETGSKTKWQVAQTLRAALG